MQVWSSLGWCTLASQLALATACGSPDQEPESDRVSSADGLYQALASYDPDPPRTGDNSLLLTLLGADEEPVEDAELDAATWMPAHGHGGATVPVVEDEGAGSYLIEHLSYTMPGTWEVRIAIDVPEGEPDTLTLRVEVR